MSKQIGSFVVLRLQIVQEAANGLKSQDGNTLDTHQCPRAEALR